MMETSATAVKVMWAAIIVLALATIGFAIWAFSAQSQANSLSSENAQQQQAIAGEQNNIDSQNESIGELQKQAASIKQGYDEAQKELAVDNKTMAQRQTEIDSLHKQLTQEEATAKNDESNLEQQLKVETTKEQLATACASLLARGLNNIYNEPANVDMYMAVSSLVKDSAKQCKDYVN